MRKSDYFVFVGWPWMFFASQEISKKFCSLSSLCFEPSLWLVRHLPKWKVPQTPKKQRHINTHNNTHASAHKRDSTSFPHLRWWSSHLPIAYRCESKYNGSLFSLNHVKSHQKQHRCATDFRIIRHFRRWIFDLITPSNSMRRKNLIIHFPRASTGVHICNRPANLCHSIREISAVFNPVWRDGKAATPAAIYTSRSSARTTPMSHFMQCCIIREKEDRVMFTYSHLWWVQENWIHAESGIIDLDSSRARNIWGLSHTGTPTDDIIKEGWTARHSHLHQYLPVNTFTFGIKMFPNETN